MVAALGQSPDTFPLSRSTIQRSRKRTRLEVAATIRAEFSPTFPLIVHWDGKILPGISGGRDVERLPVLVSGDGNEKLWVYQR